MTISLRQTSKVLQNRRMYYPKYALTILLLFRPSSAYRTEPSNLQERLEYSMWVCVFVCFYAPQRVGENIVTFLTVLCPSVRQIFCPEWISTTIRPVNLKFYVLVDLDREKCSDKNHHPIFRIFLVIPLFHFQPFSLPSIVIVRICIPPFWLPLAGRFSQ